MGYYFCYRINEKSKSKLDIIQEIMEEEWYYGKYDSNFHSNLETRMILGMLDMEKDPFTRYLTSLGTLADSFKGIGIAVNVYGEYFIIDEVNSVHAASDGIRVGDILTKVNDTDLKNKTLEELNSLINSSDNGVKLTLIRDEDTIEINTSVKQYEPVTVFSKEYPNASYVLLKYDINTIRTEYVSSEGVKQHKTDTYNSKEWLIRSVDIGGNVLYYEYYSDGLLKSTQIDNLPLTKVSVTYDNCRNKKTLNDPDYGTIIYEYDALSNLKKVKMPNNNYIEYQYDVSGRMIDRKERDASANKVVTTKWHYNAEKGKIGMLERITTSDNHIIEYVYDDKLRLSKEYETINNTTYFTTYSYDEASRVSSIRYPSGFCLSKTYSNSGYEKAGCAGASVVRWYEECGTYLVPS